MKNSSDYIPTREEIIQFGKDRAGYSSSIKYHVKKEKATHGQLVYINGSIVNVIKYNAPWALLQSLKSKYSFNDQKHLFLKGLSWKQ